MKNYAILNHTNIAEINYLSFLTKYENKLPSNSACTPNELSLAISQLIIKSINEKCSEDKLAKYIDEFISNNQNAYNLNLVLKIKLKDD